MIISSAERYREVSYRKDTDNTISEELFRNYS